MAAKQSDDKPSRTHSAHSKSGQSPAGSAEPLYSETPGFVVNESLDIVEFLGNTGPFLRIVPGAASLGLRSMLDSALQAPVCRAIESARSSGHATVAGVSFLAERQRRKVDIEVARHTAGRSGQTRYRVLIRETSREADGEAMPSRPAPAKKRRQSEVDALKRELDEQRRSSNAALAARDLKYDATLEQLHAANEQLEAIAARVEETNSELRATTEELAQSLAESQRTEQRLREGEARFRLLADSVPVLIWTNGLEGCEFVNREYLSFLGCSMEDVLGMGWARYVHPEDASAYMEGYLTAFKRQQRFERELRFRRADGEYRWFRTTGVPRFTADGTLLGYVGCTVDITEIKASEAALKEAARRKDEFLAMLGHELRNPLAGIRTGTLLLQANPSVERRTWIEQMVGRQVKQLERLVDDLLDVTRIAHGKFQLQFDTFELRECIEPAIEVTKSLLEERRHELSVSLPPEELHLDADCSRVEQIVVNLLTNASKYTPEGGKIWLSAEKAGEELVIRCKDSGIGLPPEMLEAIFEPFTQVNASRDGTVSGLGIGLTLVKKLAEMHGGSVAASSDGPGKGSEFTVWLPACVVRDFRRPKAVRKADTVTAAPSLQVLVVDDNRDLAQSTVMFLEGQGHQTRLACDGATAISLAEQHRPDIVLLDIGLPDMDGHAVAARMRTNPRLREATIIAVSGFKPDEHDGHLPHFNAHLVKPFRPEVLLELIRNRRARESAQRILLIEDNQELARLTAELLRDHGQQVEIAVSGGEGIEKAKQFHPRIVLCDLNLPDMKGVEVAQALRDSASATPFVLVAVSAASVEDLQADCDTVFDLFWSKPLTWDQVHELIRSLESDQSAKGVGR